jgi:hypothetical protein
MKIFDKNSPYCHQYQIRISNYEEDLIRVGLTLNETQNLKVDDFVFQNEDKKICFDEIKEFIVRHEFLQRMSLYPTHIFTARYKGILAGVVIIDMPSVFSKLLGDITKKIERLISRGACISWSPKNLGSSLIMYAIKWMVKHTPYRLFVAYSDVEAKELGTIYQACNFYYIGKKSGAKKQYKIESGRWVSDRYFRARSVYKKLAKNSGIEWQSEWQDGDSVKFDNMPEEIALQIKKLSKEYLLSCESRVMKLKHKYAYVLGNNNTETKELKKIFIKRNKIYSYPKERGN